MTNTLAYYGTKLNFCDTGPWSHRKGATTHRIMTLRIMTLGVTVLKHGTHIKTTLSMTVLVIMLSIVMLGVAFSLLGCMSLC